MPLRYSSNLGSTPFSTICRIPRMPSRYIAASATLLSFDHHSADVPTLRMYTDADTCTLFPLEALRSTSPGDQETSARMSKFKLCHHHPTSTWPCFCAARGWPATSLLAPVRKAVRMCCTGTEGPLRYCGTYRSYRILPSGLL